ncbi:AbiV family abortive infection protein [Arenibacter palladensis]|uniref:AbiV family abortive infection protein n=1 Tax=Arenibacter palladensis TaxID=237373 RepID=UPI0026E396CB|nr:AbiV family abortive infection protein [Arenibacter palladensis]MDO6601650.1 AbiV family abortive infection protein [Arenibacter palladensis]
MSKSRRRKKFEKFSTEAMKNAIRIHMDSILLFDNESYPSSYHLSVLALEEIAKSDWIDHYVETTTTNHGLPEPDGKDEQEWIKLLYIHRRKHFAFINQQFHFLSRDFYDFADSAKLELKKQKAIYVGLERSKKGIDTKSKISKPISQIKLNDAKKIISLNNQVLMNQCIRNIQNGFYYGPEEKYEILNQDLLIELEEKWKFKSRIIESLKIKKSR